MIKKLKTYTHNQIHKLLLKDRWDYPDCSGEDKHTTTKHLFVIHPHFEQAMHCPYYVPLESALGADWGVIINPKSSKYCEVVYEHEWCGCKCGSHRMGNQKTDQWLKK